MDTKPIYYDGSSTNNSSINEQPNNEEYLVITDEVRTNICGNPYSFESIE